MATNRDDVQPRWRFEKVIPERIDPQDPLGGWAPHLPDWPPPTTPTWWVDPRGIPSLQHLHLPQPPQRPGSSLAPGDVANPFADATANWLEAYYNQNLAQQDGSQPDNGQDDSSRPEVPIRRLGRRTYRA